MPSPETADPVGGAPLVTRKPFDWESFEAVLYDLDGVLTATARVHAAAWKGMFDEFLTGHAQ